MAVLTFPFMLFILAPPLALVPAWALWSMLRGRRRQLGRSGVFWVATAAIAWGLYTLYECAVWVWSQDQVAPIRVDLLLFAPLLYALSLAAIASYWRAGRPVSE